MMAARFYQYLPVCVTFRFTYLSTTLLRVGSENNNKQCLIPVSMWLFSSWLPLEVCWDLIRVNLICFWADASQVSLHQSVALLFVSWQPLKTLIKDHDPVRWALYLQTRQSLLQNVQIQKNGCGRWTNGHKTNDEGVSLRWQQILFSKNTLFPLHSFKLCSLLVPQEIILPDLY